MTASHSEAIRCCRSCGSSRLNEVLDLGCTPLPNSLLSSEQANSLVFEEARLPLKLVNCEACSLVQLSVTAAPETVFSNYVYFSSYSVTMLEHCESLVNRLISERGLSSDSLVVEIGSNDGCLLQYYNNKSIKSLGIDPARNVDAIAKSRGLTTVCEFFDWKLARDLSKQGVHADVIHAHNVMGHIPDLNGFLNGVKSLLKKDGVAIIEVPYLNDMLKNLEFDTIYHEHCFYFSLTAVLNACNIVGLKILDVERFAIHGGTLRLFIGHHGVTKTSVEKLLIAESNQHDEVIGSFKSFGNSVTTLKKELNTLLCNLKAERKSIAAYGAAAKGIMLLNHAGIGKNVIDFIVDRNPVKQGKYTPGGRIPIFEPSELVNRRPDYVLILPWNITDEILGQQKQYLALGGQFIVPLPRPAILLEERLASVS